MNTQKFGRIYGDPARSAGNVPMSARFSALLIAAWIGVFRSLLGRLLHNER